MKLHKTSIHKTNPSAGFTIIEVVVVFGLFTMLISMGLFLSMDAWRGTSFRSEQDIVISLLYKVRSRAIANINEESHGLYIDTNSAEYVIFEGDSYNSNNPSNLVFPMNNSFTFTGDSLVVFLAREATTGGASFTIGGEGRQKTFTINNEGGITW